MHKKYFITLTLLGAMLLFAILPWINYQADITRALHHDYHSKYDKFHANRIFLRVAYLLDNKEKYDTLVFGSSRGEFIDTNKISPKAYNMFHGFGTLSTYLASLEVLLHQGVKVKNVWIAINDFEIWKDHTHILHKLTYKEGLGANIPLYGRWLFRNSPKNIEVLTKNLPLHESDFITDPTTERIKRAYVQEKRLPKHRHIYGAMLGYTGEYKIDASIEDMKKIKQLCEVYDINLTVFTYPSFYKTYIRYDQERINELKTKLAQVVDFYDFYTLDTNSMDSSKWYDGSHFVVSTGDSMISHILNNDHLVTKKTISSHIKKSQKHLSKMLTQLPSGPIYRMQPHFDLSAYPLLFDINNSQFKTTKNGDFTLKKQEKYYAINVTGADPMFIMDQTHTAAPNNVLDFTVDMPHADVFRLYLKNKKTDAYNEGVKHSIRLKKGLNYVRVVIPKKYINNTLRVDFTSTRGEYKLYKFQIHALQEEE